MSLSRPESSADREYFREATRFSRQLAEAEPGVSHQLVVRRAHDAQEAMLPEVSFNTFSVSPPALASGDVRSNMTVLALYRDYASGGSVEKMTEIARMSTFAFLRAAAHPSPRRSAERRLMRTAYELSLREHQLNPQDTPAKVGAMRRRMLGMIYKVLPSTDGITVHPINTLVYRARTFAGKRATSTPAVGPTSAPPVRPFPR